MMFDAQAPAGTKLITVISGAFAVVHDASPLSTLVLQVRRKFSRKSVAPPEALNSWFRV